MSPCHFLDHLVHNDHVCELGLADPHLLCGPFVARTSRVCHRGASDEGTFNDKGNFSMELQFPQATKRLLEWHNREYRDEKVAPLRSALSCRRTFAALLNGARLSHPCRKLSIRRHKLINLSAFVGVPLELQKIGCPHISYWVRTNLEMLLSQYLICSTRVAHIAVRGHSNIGWIPSTKE